MTEKYCGVCRDITNHFDDDFCEGCQMFPEERNQAEEVMIREYEEEHCSDSTCCGGQFK